MRTVVEIAVEVEVCLKLSVLVVDKVLTGLLVEVVETVLTRIMVLVVDVVTVSVCTRTGTSTVVTSEIKIDSFACVVKVPVPRLTVLVVVKVLGEVTVLVT